jgi:GAF domain-containing protein
MDLRQRVAELERKLGERTAERDEALAREAAMAEVLQVINSSPGDLAPVFDAIVEKAHTLCGAVCGSLQLWDGEKFRGIAMRGFPEPMVESLRQGYTPGPNHPCRGLTDGKRIVHCADMSAVDDSVTRLGAKLSGIRTVAYVALRKDDDLLGQIVAARLEVRPFADAELTLLENFAAQAVIAIENARLISETREALEQQTATAEVLQVINSSPGDLAPVFDAILEKAHTLCGAAYGRLLVRDGEEFRFAAAHGEPRLVEVARQLGPMRLSRGGLFARLVEGERVIHIPDFRCHDSYRNAPPALRHYYDAGDVRTLLLVPLRRDNEVLGVITAFRQEVRLFTDKQIALLQNFASQAVIAMENARLINETREALEQQTATAEVLQVINSSPGDLTPVFDAILDKAHTLCGAAHGSVQLYDGENLRAVTTHAVSEKFAEVLRQGYRADDSPASRALIEGQGFVHIDDCAEIDHPVFRSAVELSGIRTVLFVPLSKEDAFLGQISAARLEVRPFTEKQIALLQNFAAQGVIAMENARLLTETREALEQQTAAAEVLQVINSSPGDLAPVFDAILERAHSLCAIDFGALQLPDGGKFRSVAARGLSEALVGLLRQPFEPVPGSPPSRLLGGERFVHIVDMAELARPGSADARAQAVSADGFRTGLFVPLRKDANLLGYIVALRREVRLYSEKEIALLENFAAQAVIAMENARLLTETRKALEQQTATAEVLQVINSSPGNLAPVFEAILEKVHTLCGAVCGSLQLWDGEKFRGIAMRGIPESMVETLRQGYSLGPNHPCSSLIDGGRIVHCADMAEVDDPVTRLGVKLSGIRTIAFVALRKDDALLGQIAAGRLEVHPFSDAELALLENFAAQAVIAMENARLLTETREALERQTATAEVLQVINSSPGNLDPVFNAILEKAHSLCGADYGALLTYDGELFHPAAGYGASARVAAMLGEGIRPGPHNSFGQLLHGEPLVHIHDMAELAERSPDDPLRRTLVEVGGIRTQLMVPLRKGTGLLGVITANRTEVQPFSDRSRCWRTSPRRRSSQWRMRGSLTRRARRWSSRPQQRRCCRSLTARPVTLRLCSTQCSKRRPVYVKGPSGYS